VQCTDDADCAAKRGHWEKVHDMIEKHNEEAARGLHAFTMQHTIHSHLNEEERNNKLGYRRPKEGSTFNPKYEDQLAEYNRTMSLKTQKKLPEEIDWRNHNGKSYVTPVKKQICGSCWTFAATAVLESQWAIKNNGEQIILSEQNLKDCSWTSEDFHGCQGGFAAIAWTYVASTEDNPAIPEQTRVKGKSHTGQNYHTAYPNIRGENGRCNFVDTPSQIGFADWKFTVIHILKYHNKPLMEAVAHIGPVAVAIHMNDFMEQHGKLIVHPKYCKTKDGRTKKTNHAVTLVGYGKKYDAGYKREVKFWIIKNSYGTVDRCPPFASPYCKDREVGDKGYWRLYRSDNMSVEEDEKEDGTCGILTDPSYPFVVKPNQE